MQHNHITFRQIQALIAKGIKQKRKFILVLFNNVVQSIMSRTWNRQWGGKNMRVPLSVTLNAFPQFHQMNARMVTSTQAWLLPSLCFPLEESSLLKRNGYQFSLKKENLINEDCVSTLITYPLFMTTYTYLDPLVLSLGNNIYRPIALIQTSVLSLDGNEQWLFA